MANLEVPARDKLRIDAHFFNVKTMELNANVSTQPIMFKNLQWTIVLDRQSSTDQFVISVDCQKHRGLKESFIKIKSCLTWPEATGKEEKNWFGCEYKDSQNISCIKFITFDEIDEYLTGNDLVFHLDMKYVLSEGINMEIMDFSIRKPGFNERLVASGVEFYVNENLLRLSSPKLARHFSKDKCYEKIIYDFNACLFQNYLELTYGENGLTDGTVCGVLAIASFLETKIVLQSCEKFLVENSLFSKKKKMDLADEYELNWLMNHLLSNVPNKPYVLAPVGTVTLD